MVRPSDNTSTRALYSIVDKRFLGLLTLFGVVIGLVGIFHLGYIGQDFTTHSQLILTYPGGYNFTLTNPPGLYWFGSLVRNCLTDEHYLEVVALTFLTLNTLALWIVYGFIWKIIARPELRLAAAAFVTLVPFRVIHSVVLAADASTLPIFALVALFTLRLYEDPASKLSWVGLSLTLVAGVLLKYTVCGLMPPVALLLSVSIVRRLLPAQRLRWAGVGAVALAIPAGIFLYEMSESWSVKGSVTDQQWLPKGAPSVMRWQDILTLQRSDTGVLNAPEYFRDKVYGPRKFSYPALLHLSAVTDLFGFFQPPPASVSTDWDARTHEDFLRGRSAPSQALQEWSVRWCLGFSALAVVGTLLCCALGGWSLATGRALLPDPATVLTALAVGFYSTVFFSLPRLLDPYTPGFWLPRLVLPAIVAFYALGFVSVDLALRRLGPRRTLAGVLGGAFAGYTLVACALFAGFLL